MTAARKPRPLNLSSHTELSTLSQCERQWWYKYVKKIKSEQSPAMVKGIVLGIACNAFWRSESWPFAVAQWVCEEGADPNLIEINEITEDPFADVVWLMHRYERQYADMRSKVKVLGQEIDCRAKIPGTTQVHQAILDELWQIGRRKYMVERKSYGRNDKSDLVDYDPQLTNNFWVAQEFLGIKLDGIIWDGIYTHHWTPTKPTQGQLIAERIAEEEAGNGGPGTSAFAGATKVWQREWAREAIEAHPGIDRPDGDSFQQIRLDRTPKHIEAAQQEIRGQLRRRAQLRKGVQPMRNITQWCKGCPANKECFEDLAFPQAFDVVE